MFLIVLTLALATGAQDAPQPPILGPKRLCFKYSSFLLEANERVTEVQMGLEGMGIEVEGPLGRFTVRESEIFAKPENLGERVSRNQDTSYYLNGKPLSYAVRGRTSYSPDRETLVLWLSGPALTGQATDMTIYNRIAVGDPASLPCDKRYLYGWDIILGKDE